MTLSWIRVLRWGVTLVTRGISPPKNSKSCHPLPLLSLELQCGELVHLVNQLVVQ